MSVIFSKSNVNISFFESDRRTTIIITITKLSKQLTLEQIQNIKEATGFKYYDDQQTLNSHHFSSGLVVGEDHSFSVNIYFEIEEVLFLQDMQKYLEKLLAIVY